MVGAALAALQALGFAAAAAAVVAVTVHFHPVLPLCTVWAHSLGWQWWWWWWYCCHCCCCCCCCACAHAPSCCYCSCPRTVCLQHLGAHQTRPDPKTPLLLCMHHHLSHCYRSLHLHAHFQSLRSSWLARHTTLPNLHFLHLPDLCFLALQMRLLLQRQSQQQQRRLPGPEVCRSPSLKLLPQGVHVQLLLLHQLQHALLRCLRCSGVVV